MAEVYGYAGKILRVDLTNNEVTETPSSDYLPQYIGGRGLGAKIYWDEVPESVGALDPDNRLIFATGPFSATGALGASRTNCISKSPVMLPNSIYTGSSGGHWGNELKFAGYDALIVQGKADKPVYIWINDGNIEIRDAKALWGLTIRQTREEVLRIHGSKAQVMSIGPAGENQVIAATISCESSSAFAEGGQGAVMGSKNLKAIVVRGTGRIKVANPTELLEVNDNRRNLLSIKVGETKTLASGDAYTGTWPTPNLFNFISSLFPPSQVINETKIGKVKMKHSGCPGCLPMCKMKLKSIDNSFPTGASECVQSLGYQAPEYLYDDKANGSLAWEFSILTDDLGLDAMAVGELPLYLGYPPDFSEKGPGNTIAVMSMWHEAYKRGILTEENTGWPWKEYGSKYFLETCLRSIAYKEGFGEILAKETKEAVDYIVEHEEFGPDRAQMEYLYQKCFPNTSMSGQPRHDFTHPYGVNSMSPLQSIYCATTFHRGKEPHIIWGTEPPAWLEKWFGVSDQISDYSYWGEEVAKASIVMDHFSEANDSTPSCVFNCWQMQPWISFGQLGVLFDDLDTYVNLHPHGTPEYWNAIFGEEKTHDELMKKMEMLVNLERAIWVRDGYTEVKPDTYYDCIFQETDPEGNLTIPKENFETLVGYYYQLRGWKDGVPTRAKLEELDLKYVADELEAKGLLPA